MPERCPGLFLLWLGSPGLAVVLELPCFRDKAVGDVDDLNLCDRLACRGHVIEALIQPCVEALEGLVRIKGFSELPVVPRQVCCQYPRVACL